MGWIAVHADLLLAVATTCLLLAVLPIIRLQWKRKASTVPLSASLLMVVILGLIAVVDLSLSLLLAAGLTGLEALGWLVLAWQRCLYGGKTCGE
jgi:hypothetical protein